MGLGRGGRDQQGSRAGACKRTSKCKGCCSEKQQHREHSPSPAHLPGSGLPTPDLGPPLGARILGPKETAREKLMVSSE